MLCFHVLCYVVPLPFTFCSLMCMMQGELPAAKGDVEVTLGDVEAAENEDKDLTLL